MILRPQICKISDTKQQELPGACPFFKHFRGQISCVYAIRYGYHEIMGLFYRAIWAATTLNVGLLSSGNNICMLHKIHDIRQFKMDMHVVKSKCSNY